MIPEDIQKKIDKAVDDCFFAQKELGYKEHDCNIHSEFYQEGANFGYSLVQEKITELEKENEKHREFLSEVIRLKNSATSTQELFPLLQYINKIQSINTK